jgi:Fur family zinc uptake transcriptional regulator
MHADNVRQIVMACDRCRTVVELDGGEVFEDLEQKAKRSGFQPERTLIEISGRCGRCEGSAA